MQTSMLLADNGTPPHDTMPTARSRRSIHGATPGILNDNQTLDWTKRGMEMHEGIATGDGLLWEPVGLAEGCEVWLLCTDMTFSTKSSCKSP